LIEERGTAGLLTAEYVYGANVDELIKKSSAAGTVYYHEDAIGNVVLLTDQSGNVVEKYSYDIYGSPVIKSPAGAVVPVSAFDNRFLFTGREYIPEAGLYDFRHRFYLPVIGRFLQLDPLRFDAEDYNLYRYAGNNPVNRIDPFGPGGMPIVPVSPKNPQMNSSLRSYEIANQYTGLSATQSILPDVTPISRSPINGRKTCRRIVDPLIIERLFASFPSTNPNAWMLMEVWICIEPGAPDPLFQNPFMNVESWLSNGSMLQQPMFNSDLQTSGSWNPDPYITISWFVDPWMNDPWMIKSP
jgi:RHS repeat-associated protein